MIKHMVRYDIKKIERLQEIFLNIF